MSNGDMSIGEREMDSHEKKGYSNLGHVMIKNSN